MQIEIALKNVHFKHVDFPIYNKLLCKQDIISIKICILLNTWKNTRKVDGCGMLADGVSFFFFTIVL